MSNKKNKNYYKGYEIKSMVVDETTIPMMKQESIEKDEKKPAFYATVSNSGKLNVRADKSINSKVIRVLEPGARIILENDDGEWGKLEGEDAWVMLKWVSF